ncbi:hypothetical protein SERLADRAFT_404852 [Serpula lacrymans var. lacrymans S7.9]|uniref:Uncharacterized protein n=1 Tax=Serpula lacrymans var. lacrymans (strain S7.9) TaxID=578457 RepID=F8NFM7_SERL9|nr:uncharacterized protein SERLADRAFT_404852 [Serpula lacrymans var. lacrymans S7.9]EGO30867.1 hypothetical protein SERLADRAFT_404852 [Serpula lacrymans var. lacrymans S7.9]
MDLLLPQAIPMAFKFGVKLTQATCLSDDLDITIVDAQTDFKHALVLQDCNNNISVSLDWNAHQDWVPQQEFPNLCASKAFLDSHINQESAVYNMDLNQESHHVVNDHIMGKDYPQQESMHMPSTYVEPPLYNEHDILVAAVLQLHSSSSITVQISAIWASVAEHLMQLIVLLVSIMHIEVEDGVGIILQVQRDDTHQKSGRIPIREVSHNTSRIIFELWDWSQHIRPRLRIMVMWDAIVFICENHLLNSNLMLSPSFSFLAQHNIYHNLKTGFSRPHNSEKIKITFSQIGVLSVSGLKQGLENLVNVESIRIEDELNEFQLYKRFSGKNVSIDSWFNQSCGIWRLVSLFDSISDMVAEHNWQIYEQDDKENLVQPQDYSEEGFKELVYYVPALKKKLNEDFASNKELASIYKQLQKGLDGAQGDNTGNMKPAAVQWLPELFPTLFTTTLDPLDKSWQGFLHNLTGSLICPITANLWPTFMYANYKYNPKDIEKGLFQSTLLLKLYFNYQQLYNNILDFFKMPPGPTSKTKIENLLLWWNRKVFGHSQAAVYSPQAIENTLVSCQQIE